MPLGEAKDLATGECRRFVIKKCLDDVNARLPLEGAGHRMADLGVRSEAADLGHVPPFDGDAIALGWFERFWDNCAHGLRSALVGDDELMHVLVVPGPTRISGSQRRHHRILQEPAVLRSLCKPFADSGCLAGYNRVVGFHIHGQFSGFSWSKMPVAADRLAYWVRA